MKKFLTDLSVGISIILLVACSAVPTPTVNNLVAVTSSPTLTHPAPKTTMPQIPILLPTGTPYPYSTSTPERPLAEVCLTIEDFIPGQTSIEGVLLLKKTESGRYDFAYDLKHGSYRAFPLVPTSGRSIGTFAISPNGKWTAFIESTFNESGESTGRYLAVADANGKKLGLPTWSFVNVQILNGWINNEQIALVIPDKPIGTVVALNPFTGKVEYIPPPAPNIENFGQYIPYAWVLYDPSLTHVIYVSKNVDNRREFFLKDISNQQILWEDQFSFGDIPKWAPDGNSFVLFRKDYRITSEFMYGEILTQVSWDGKALSLTQTQPAIGNEEWSWSPDSQFIAIWLNPKGFRQIDYSARSLTLVNVAERSSIDFCLESINLSSAGPPVWSPSSQFIAIPLYEDTGNYFTSFWKTIIVDIKNNKAYKFMENVVPVGWMAEP